MARSQTSFLKKQKADKKAKNRKEKLERKHNKKNQKTDGSLENMLVYIDKYGNFSDTPPEEEEEDPSDKK